MRTIRSTTIAILAIGLLAGSAVGVAAQDAARESPHGEPGLDVRELEWAPLVLDETTFGPDARLVDIAASDSMLVIGGSVGSIAAVWTSTDRLNWKRVPHKKAVFGGPGDQEIKAIVPWRDGFVAAGEVGGVRDFDPRRVAVVWYSEDGKIWTRVPHDEKVFGGKGRQEMFDIAASDDRLVIVGFDEEGPAAGGSDDIAVWTSADGIDWKEQTFGGGEMLAVAGAAEGFVGVGHRGMWTSPDGLHWEPEDPGDLRYAVLLGLAQTPSGFVAVGSAQDRPAAWTFTDGGGWTSAEIVATYSEDEFWMPQDVASARSGLVQVAGPGMWDGTSLILVSEDGHSWVPGVTSTPASDARLGRIAAFGDHFVAIGGPRRPGEGGQPNIWTTFEPSVLSSEADAAAQPEPLDSTTTAPDLLLGVDLVTEEVEPGVYRVLGDGVRDLDSPEDPRFAGMWTGPDGSVWRSYLDLYRIGDAGVSHLPPQVSRYTGEWDHLTDQDGTIWIAFQDLWSFDGERWRQDPSFGREHRRIRAIELGPEGDLWAAWSPEPLYEDGSKQVRVSRLTDVGWVDLPGAAGFESVSDRTNLTPFFAIDADGDPWISGIRRGDSTAAGPDGPPVQGLLHFDGSAWEFVDPVGSGPYDVWSSLVATGSDGTLWATFRNDDDGTGFLAKLAEGMWTVYSSADGVPESMTRIDQSDYEGAIRAASDGSVWMTASTAVGSSEERPAGVAHFDGHSWHRYLSGQQALDIDVASDGRAWVLTGDGTYVITPEAVAAAE